MSEVFFLIECKKCGYTEKRETPFTGLVKVDKDDDFYMCMKCPKCDELICKQYSVRYVNDKKIKKEAGILADISLMKYQ